MRGDKEPLGSIREHLGSIREHVGSIREHLGSIREHLGSIREHLGSTREHLGSVRERLGSATPSCAGGAHLLLAPTPEVGDIRWSRRKRSAARCPPGSRPAAPATQQRSHTPLQGHRASYPLRRLVQPATHSHVCPRSAPWQTVPPSPRHFSQAPGRLVPADTSTGRLSASHAHHTYIHG